jgi:hypothetical protein
MFTVIALFAIAILGWLAQRENKKEHERIARFSDEEMRQSICLGRQDIRLIAYVLAAILVMLGIIADKV